MRILLEFESLLLCHMLSPAQLICAGFLFVPRSVLYTVFFYF